MQLQAQDLPRPSPLGKTSQVVGLTNISIEYSRPGVKDRTVWGELVPYNEVWRAGANKATLFETDADIRVNGQNLPAGKYSLFIVPREGNNWTLIFNKETELWGSGDYKVENDQLRVEADVVNLACDAERLDFHFTDVDMKSAVLAMDWEKKRMFVNIDSDPLTRALANIQKAIETGKEEDKWRIYRNAASFAKDQGNMTDQGLAWVEESVKLKDSWYGYWLYAQLLEQKQNYTEAVAKAQKAIEVGRADAKGGEFDYEARIQEDIDRWKAAK